MKLLPEDYQMPAISYAILSEGLRELRKELDHTNSEAFDLNRYKSININGEFYQFEDIFEIDFDEFKAKRIADLEIRIIEYEELMNELSFALN
jgi:hypothetical protein